MLLDMVDWVQQMPRKYINDLGLDDTLMNLKSTDKRKLKWKHEIKRYGFASYETWSLDYAFYAWLYERLQMYLKKAEEIVDLTYHKFEFKGKEYTQKELIDKMIYGCKIALLNPTSGWELSKKEQEAVEDIPWIWATVIQAMWW